MLDPRTLRRDPEEVARRLARRGHVLDLNLLADFERSRRDLQMRTETLQSERNQTSKAIGLARARGEDSAPMVEAMSNLRVRLDAAKQELTRVQAEYNEFLLHIPNIPSEEVPVGETDADNKELWRVGEPRNFEFPPRDHMAVGGALIDPEAAVRVTGSRFSVFYDELARLHRALIQFMIDIHVTHHGYREVYVPYIVNEDTMRGTGQLPKFEEDLFRVASDAKFYLIPTAEVPVTNLIKDQILDDASVPLKFVCHTPCFRREAGSAGRDTHGLIRQHQFEKVELVQIVRPSESWDALEELTGHAETVLKELELPYRAVDLCGGDLGFAAARTIDLEVWLPGSQAYREISSCSNFLDFQARRARIRWRNPETGRPEPAHTLNGSGLAIGRTMIAVMENFQQADGSVRMPPALRPYMRDLEYIL
ncbi:MAG: serine--tRNA ligase [Pseudomonadales bacterium]|nr:serine--tRNA ligase [Pseudomonadales bacterium]